jgi:alkylation response protein AidB-like acyl-CoA dehydrogenase
MKLTFEQEALRTSLRRHLRENVAPHIAAAERGHLIPQDIVAGLAEFGCIGGTLPENAGGYGLDHATWALIMEELGYAWGSLRTIVNVINTFLRLVNRSGTEWHHERFAKPVLASEKKICLALSEPDFGSDIAGIKTRAEDRGDHYLVNGSKLWITNGVNSDFIALLARTYSPSCEGELSLFIVDRAESPVPAKLVDKMVLKASGTSELTFENVCVPKTHRLGAEGTGLKAVLVGLNFGRLNIALGAAGAARAALDLSIEYAKSRKQFGRAIGSFQLVQKHIVDMLVRTEAARALGYSAAAALDRGESARVECSVAKLYATEAAQEVARLAMHVHGGLGYSTEYPIERIFRDCVGNAIPEGTPDIQTLIIGREVLGISALT